MIDPVGLDRVQMVRQMIAQYEDEIAQERSRVGNLRTDLTQAQLVAQELAERGDTVEARRTSLRAHDLRHKVEYGEEQIDEMEEILDVFRRKLTELQRVA
jgi:hypothetical protein